MCMFICDFQLFELINKGHYLPLTNLTSPHELHPSSQIKMFATQLTMAVNMFVLILMIPISASVVRTSY